MVGGISIYFVSNYRCYVFLFDVWSGDEDEVVGVIKRNCRGDKRRSSRSRLVE